MQDESDDFTILGVKLAATIAALQDPEAKASGSDAASLARTRRLMAAGAPDDQRLIWLRSDYDMLAEALQWSGGSGAAAVANERRMIREILTALEAPVEVPLVDQLAERRKSRTKSGGAAGRRRKSG